VSVRVLIIGAGNAGLRIAEGLARSSRVDRLVLCDISRDRAPLVGAILDSCYDCDVKFIELDGTRQKSVEEVLRTKKPDLVLQSACLLSPWATLGRSDPTSQALSQAGLAVQLPVQLPVLTTVMKAVRQVDFKGPVANLSFPDVTHMILDRFGLAPTVGLGNVSICHLRVRAALRKTSMKTHGSCAPFPLIRLVGHHHHVYGVMEATPPADPQESCRVYLGERGERADELAYQGFPIKTGIDFNIITAAAALRVLLALLPGAEPLRFSAPAPQGLPGGYPVVISDGKVELDLPETVDLTEAKELHQRMARLDGIESISDDGTVQFSEKAKKAVADIDPALSEPLRVKEWIPRALLLKRHVGA